jgi:hypothetical protein
MHAAARTPALSELGDAPLSATGLETELDKDQEKHVRVTHFIGQGGGQGRGRTADLPIFRSWDNSSPNTVDVRDLRFFAGLNADELRRT